MRIRKLGLVLLVAVILMLGLCACEPEVITVADIQEGQEVQYIEVQEFALKEVVEDDGKVQVKHCGGVCRCHRRKHRPHVRQLCFRPSLCLLPGGVHHHHHRLWNDRL